MLSRVNYIVKLIGIILFVFYTDNIKAQSNSNDTLRSQAIVYQGDTIPLTILEYVYVYSQLTAAQKQARAAYDRLRNAVYVTYPYARKAGIIS